jgi:hypothetical protein
MSVLRRTMLLGFPGARYSFWKSSSLLIASTYDNFIIKQQCQSSYQVNASDAAISWTS